MVEAAPHRRGLLWRSMTVGATSAIVLLLFQPIFGVVGGGTFALLLLPVVLGGLLLGLWLS